MRQNILYQRRSAFFWLQKNQNKLTTPLFTEGDQNAVSHKRGKANRLV